MEKTIHFLAGLPRSGNTLLSAILNQNPDIYSSPLSVLPSLMYDCSKALYTEPNCLRSPEVQMRTEKIIKSIPKIYYDNVQKPIIIDREKAWGTPANLGIIKEFITLNPKIIFTTRTITDILASYIALDFEVLKNEYRNSGFYNLYYLPFDDGYLDYVMRPNGEMDKILLSLSGAIKEENKGMFHIVEYEDLLKDPKLVMDKIYSFLELPSFNHDFNNIKKVELDFDEALNHPKHMHDVRAKLDRPPTNAKNLLSDYIYNKYKNTEFWRK